MPVSLRGNDDVFICGASVKSLFSVTICFSVMVLFVDGNDVSTMKRSVAVVSVSIVCRVVCSAAVNSNRLIFVEFDIVAEDSKANVVGRLINSVVSPISAGGIVDDSTAAAVVNKELRTTGLIECVSA